MADGDYVKEQVETLRRIKSGARAHRAPVLGGDPDLGFAIGIVGDIVEHALWRHGHREQEKK